jgi:diadenosine tetraphosphate (Ap4A) HIT family hydrolase
MSAGVGSTAIHRRVEALREGRDPSVIAKMSSGWAVFGERQFLRGYALLLPDPVVPTLNDLPASARDLFLSDMSRLGDALLAVTGALRINYAMFGNLEPALHAHVIPRYREESPPLDVAHPWAYDWNAAPVFDPVREAALLEAVRASLASSASQSSRA